MADENEPVLEGKKKLRQIKPLKGVAADGTKERSQCDFVGKLSFRFLCHFVRQVCFMFHKCNLTVSAREVKCRL